MEGGDRGPNRAQGPAQRPRHRQQERQAWRIPDLQGRADEVDGPVSHSVGDRPPQGDVDTVVVEGADQKPRGQTEQQVRHDHQQADGHRFCDVAALAAEPRGDRGDGGLRQAHSASADFTPVSYLLSFR